MPVDVTMRSLLTSEARWIRESPQGSRTQGNKLEEEQPGVCVRLCLRADEIPRLKRFKMAPN